MERGFLTHHIRNLLIEHHLLSATELVDLLDKQGHSYNKTSVYRALTRMIDEGELCRQHLASNQVSYELRDSHDHLVCEKCGKVVAISSIYTPPKKLSKFKVAHHHLTLYGECHDCKK